MLLFLCYNLFGDIMEKRGKLIGSIVGAIVGILTTILSNPVGRFAIFTAQDEYGLKVLRFFEDLFNSRAAGDTAYRIYCAITNAIMAYPAILTIAVGLISSLIGYLIGKRINRKKRLKKISTK
jgi:ABC-type antimicrobial peptide transport system permease subunit